MVHFNLKNNQGFSIIEGMIASGILAVIVVGAMSAFQSIANAKLKNDVLTSIIKYRFNIISSLRSPEAISNAGVINGVPCLVNHLSCAATSTPYSPLTVPNATGEKLTDKDDGTLGFRADMMACTSFPSAECPFRYETAWRSVCNGAFCSSPQLKVRGVLKLFSGLKVVINQNVYSFEISLGQVLGTYEQSCTSIGGSYYPGNPPRCDLPMVGDCPSPGDVVVGYDRTARTKKCRPYFQSFFNGVSVPPGSVAIGIDPSGNPIIRPIRMPVVPAPFRAQIAPPNSQPAIFGDGVSYPTDGGAYLFPTDGGGGDGGCGGGGGC